jgi:hypothetical protein
MMSGRNSTARRRWTEAEDTTLRRLVAAAKEDDENQIVWRDIATEIDKRGPNQCRERWTNHLRPGIKRGDWSTEEDETIEHLQQQIGNHWSQIAAALDKRTDIDVKNRWHKLQRSKRRPDAVIVPTPRVGMKVLVRFEEEGYNKLYDGIITSVDNDEEQPDADAFFLLQIQYEDGSFEDDCTYPDNDIYLVDCQSNNDGLTEEEVSLSSELLNIHNSLLANGGNGAKNQRTTLKDGARLEEKISVKENQRTNHLHNNAI